MTGIIAISVTKELDACLCQNHKEACLFNTKFMNYPPISLDVKEIGHIIIEKRGNYIIIKALIPKGDKIKSILYRNQTNMTGHDLLKHIYELKKLLISKELNGMIFIQLNDINNSLECFLKLVNVCQNVTNQFTNLVI